MTTTRQTAKAKLLDRASVDQSLSATDFRALAVLLTHLNLQTGLCCPSAERVAQLMKVSAFTVYRSTKALRKHGYLTLKQRRSTSPLCVFPAIQELAPMQVPDLGTGTHATQGLAPMPVRELAPMPDKPIEGEPIEENLSVGARKRATTTSKRTRIPPEAVIDDCHLAYAAELGIQEAEARAEFDKFKDHHLAKGSAFIDWRAAWRTWCRNSIEFASRRGNSNGSQRPQYKRSTMMDAARAAWLKEIEKERDRVGKMDDGPEKELAMQRLSAMGVD
jgi:Helix-turn-helix domain